ncbi:hypothetical protein AB0I28_24425 [Phytomonospora sp. NPDC050363]|uniref:hypothetical protein n=1 Tax=Phytomonospora sp. NPDC050363 TaxID=3155642 RepID=UPI0033D4FC93
MSTIRDLVLDQLRVWKMTTVGECTARRDGPTLIDIPVQSVHSGNRPAGGKR